MFDLFDGPAASRVEVKQSTAAKKIAEHIVTCIGYHDTVVFVVNDLSAWPLLTRLLDYALDIGAVSKYCLKPMLRFQADRRVIRHSVALNQPSRGLLLKLDEALCQSHYRLTRVDTAYDFVVKDARGLKSLRAFFERRAVVKLSKREPVQYKKTSYLSGLRPGEKNPRENVVIYENKKSIFNDATNVHVERRRHHKRNVATAGIKNLRGLANYDFNARIGEDLSLHEVSNKSEIGKLLLKAEQWEGKNPEKAGLRAFNSVFESEQFTSQAIWMRQHAGRDYLKRICMRPFPPVMGFGNG